MFHPRLRSFLDKAHYLTPRPGSFPDRQSVFHHNQLFVYILATFGNPNAGGGINNGASPIKLEAHNTGSNYYTCATYGSPSPGANEHQQSLLATSAYSKFKRKQTIITHVVVNVNNATDTSGHTHRLSLEVRGSFRSYFNRQKNAQIGIYPRNNVV